MSRVLLIDDDERLRSMLAKTLRRAGYEVEQACNGDEGLAICRQNSPDAVVTDVGVPGEEGSWSIIEMRREFPELPVVATSGGLAGPRDCLLLARRLGAVMTLSKPFLPADLLEALRQAVTTNRS